MDVEEENDSQNYPLQIKISKDSFIQVGSRGLRDAYENIKKLGKGSFGKVFQVRNKATNKLYACKKLSKLNIDSEQFQKEIKILMQMDHPNIIKLYEVFESQRSLYLVMEECKGGEIFDRIIQHIQKKEMYSEKDAATIFQQVMSAIEYCHNNGICHRDLKPENILYLNEGAEKDNPIKVIDFGLSQVISSDKKLSTKVGTAYYVSPEILLGEYTEKCDIWSAGVILYIFLSGDPPFNGSNDHAIYTKISKMKFTFPEKKWKNISNEAKDLISHMITPEKERYTAKQVLSHPWFSNASTVPLSELNFDSSFFVDYEKSSELKKMTLLFIASRLDENEINNLKKSFEAIDNSKDGQITFEELKSGLIQLKSNKMNENEIKELFDLIDVDQNGKIDYTEFIASTLQKKNYLRNERLLEAFCMFDKDNSGQITKDELLEALKAKKKK
jgi:calcium-dependent protein kinase